MTDILSIKKNITEIETRLSLGLDTRRRQQPDALSALDSIQSRYDQMQTELRNAQNRIILLESTLDGIGSKLSGILKTMSQDNVTDDVVLQRVIAIEHSVSCPSPKTTDVERSADRVETGTDKSRVAEPDSSRPYGAGTERSQPHNGEADIAPRRNRTGPDRQNGTTETARLLKMEDSAQPESAGSEPPPQTQRKSEEKGSSPVYETYESFEFRSAQVG